MNGLSRLLLRNGILFFIAQLLIWLPWIQAVNSPVPPMDSLLGSTVLASLGILLLFSLHVLLQIRKNRHRQNQGPKAR